LISPLLNTNSMTTGLPAEETVLRVVIPAESHVKEEKIDLVATTTGTINRAEGEERTEEKEEKEEIINTPVTSTEIMNRVEGEEKTGEREEIISSPATTTIGRIIRDMAAKGKMVPPEKGETRETLTETTTD